LINFVKAAKNVQRIDEKKFLIKDQQNNNLHRNPSTKKTTQLMNSNDYRKNGQNNNGNFVRIKIELLVISRRNVRLV